MYIQAYSILHHPHRNKHTSLFMSFFLSFFSSFLISFFPSFLLSFSLSSLSLSLSLSFLQNACFLGFHTSLPGFPADTHTPIRQSTHRATTRRGSAPNPPGTRLKCPTKAPDARTRFWKPHDVGKCKSAKREQHLVESRLERRSGYSSEDPGPNV